MKQLNYYFGIDIGGTTAKLMLMDDQGLVVTQTAIKTDISEKGSKIVVAVCQEVERLLSEKKIAKENCLGIGIGSPGQVNASTQVIIQAVNIGWINYPLKKEVEALLGIPTYIDNDANVAAFGELKQGAGKGKSSAIVVTLGTGVGGGIIIDGNILSGTTGAGGEIGHMRIILDGGRSCNCGNTGCLETLVSASGIVNEAKDRLEAYPKSVLHNVQTLTSKVVFAEATKGDKLAILIYEQTAKYLGSALANLAHVLNPELFIIGGGVAQAGETFLHLVRQYFREFAILAVRDVTAIKLANLGNYAGMIGAAVLAKEMVTKNK